METHAAQDVKMVLMHAGQYPLADGGECAFVVGQKDCLNEKGSINVSNTPKYGWYVSERRSWCNSIFYNSLPTIIKNIFRQFANTSAGGKENSPTVSNDFFSLFAEKEVFGTNTYADATAEATLFQIEYFKNATNRIKKVNSYNEYWFLRSLMSGGSTDVCLVSKTGTPSAGGSNYFEGIAPFGCIGKKVTA